ncbi:MAG: hypothetical protein ACRC62_04730, partial [Microcoleus sp.]
NSRSTEMQSTQQLQEENAKALGIEQEGDRTTNIESIAVTTVRELAQLFGQTEASVRVSLKRAEILPLRTEERTNYFGKSEAEAHCTGKWGTPKARALSISGGSDIDTRSAASVNSDAIDLAASNRVEAMQEQSERATHMAFGMGATRAATEATAFKVGYEEAAAQFGQAFDGQSQQIAQTVISGNLSTLSELTQRLNEVASAHADSSESAKKKPGISLSDWL